MRHHGTYYITNNYSSLRFVLLRVGTSDSLVVREDEFWLSANVVRQKPRNRRYAALSLRRPDRIAAEEYRLAINAVLRGSVAASKSELTASVGNGGNRRYRRKTRDYAIGKRRIEDLR